jgi:hypothetical protein
VIWNPCGEWLTDACCEESRDFDELGIRLLYLYNNQLIGAIPYVHTPCVCCGNAGLAGEGEFQTAACTNSPSVTSSPTASPTVSHSPSKSPMITTSAKASTPLKLIVPVAVGGVVLLVIVAACVVNRKKLVVRLRFASDEHKPLLHPRSSKRTLGTSSLVTDEALGRCRRPLRLCDERPLLSQVSSGTFSSIQNHSV